jgi:hypothetical protein
MDMKRVAVLCVGILVLAFVPAVVSAQGLLPGLPAFGVFLGGPYTCVEKPFPRVAAPVLYVGWMEGPKGTSFGVDTDGVGLGGITKIFQRYPNRGVWFGLADTVALTDSMGFMASAWYLVPSNAVSQQTFNDGGTGFDLFGRSWNTENQWWWVDGLFAFGPCCGPASLLVGLRYDFFTVRFKDPPFDPVAPPPVIDRADDEADLISYNVIPLIGVQASYGGSCSKLTMRAVGFPAVFGSVKYNETVLIVNRAQATGNYTGGGFLEVFAEYSRKFSGADVGVFGRWNYLHGNSNLNFDLLPTGGSQTFKLGLTRTSWTLGGSFSLNFNTPI